jgi:hypothetical protein
MKADIIKILDAITDKVLAHGPARKNADKRPKVREKPKEPIARKNKPKN